MDDQIDLIRTEPFRLGRHTVRPASCDVVSEGGRVVLQPRIMQVLVAMARRSGGVLSREDLIAQCWQGRAVGDDAVHRSMAILRKLSRELGGFSIETIKRVGYSLTSADVEPALTATRKDAAEEPAIAVLPFANISEDPKETYFSEGLTEEFICQLSLLSGVRVAGRTAVAALRSGERDLGVLGRELGVGYALEGSVRRAGQRLRITARLLDCAQGFELWSETYDRELGDVFGIQEEVAAAVCRALSLRLGIDAEAPDYGGTKSFDAYDHFLKAGRVWHHLPPQEIDARAAHLRQALEIDPDYGLGWATLACLLTQRRGMMPAAEHPQIDKEKAQAAARARALAPDLPEAHIAQGCVETDKKNWLAADEHCMRGVRRGPGHRPQAEHLVAGFLAATGRFRAGLPYRQASRDYDPLSMGFSVLLLSSYLALRAWPEFDAEYARGREIEGRHADAEALRLFRLLATGADDAAVTAQYATLLAEGPSHPMFADVAAAHGKPGELRGVLERWSDEPEPRFLYTLAHMAGSYGHDDLAATAVRKAGPAGPSGMLQMTWMPGLRGVRQDPRFRDTMEDVGLVRFWRTSGKWPDYARPLGEDDIAFD